MNTIFVTRHQGAIDWAREEGLLPGEVRVVADFDADTTVAGDLVIGTLPAQLAARICERGGRYQHLTLDLTPEMRGRELSAADMRSCNARLEEFFIQRSSVAAPAGGRRIIHLCVVSDQTLQNLLPVRVAELKPERCVLLLSAGMKKKQADLPLRHALKEAGCPAVDLEEGLPDHDLNAVIDWGNALIRRLRAQYPGQRFVFNLTGGNKLMSLGLLQALRPWCEAIYCDTANDMVEVVHPSGRAPIALAPDAINLRLYLAAQGFTMREQSFDPARIDQRSEVSSWLATNAANLGNFIAALNRAAGHYNENPSERTASPTLEPSSSELVIETTRRLVDAGLLEKQRDGKCRLPKRHAAYLGGGWLEEYCWVVGRELEREGLLKRARFAIDVNIDPIRHGQHGRHPYNQIDALFVHRNRMLIVECKTGNQLRIKGRSQNILNRLEALGHAAGLFAQKWLLSTEKAIDPATRKRAEEYRIGILSAEELPQLKDVLRRWMGH